MHIEEILIKLNICLFVIKDNELLGKYNEIWEKVSSRIKKGFDSESVYIETYLKTKIRSYNGNINKNFHNNKISKEGSLCIYILVILIDSGYRRDKNYYP